MKPESLSSSTIPRVMDLRGTYKGGGGPDKTILNSAAQHDPGKVYVLVTYLRQPHDQEFQIAGMAERLGINYVEVIDRKFLDWACLWQLRHLIQAHTISLIHVHDDKTLLYAWILKMTTPGVRIMYTCHSHAVHVRSDFSSLKEFLSFKLRQRMQIFLMKRFAKPILTISENTKARLVTNGLAREDVAVLHNGIDTEFWRSERGTPVLRKELKLGNGHFLVGTVARITAEKDLPTFYRVAKLVREQIPNVSFVIVGDGHGDELPRAREAVVRLGLEDVIHFMGHRNDLVDIYASLDVFLMTSVTEGMPNTLLEAMAMGIPVVATSVGGIPELLPHGDGGFLATSRDAESLAAHVIMLLKNGLLRENLHLATRKRIESFFSFSRRVRTMEEHYACFSHQCHATTRRVGQIQNT